MSEIISKFYKYSAEGQENLHNTTFNTNLYRG